MGERTDDSMWTSELPQEQGLYYYGVPALYSEVYTVGCACSIDEFMKFGNSRPPIDMGRHGWKFLGPLPTPKRLAELLTAERDRDAALAAKDEEIGRLREAIERLKARKSGYATVCSGCISFIDMDDATRVGDWYECPECIAKRREAPDAG